MRKHPWIVEAEQGTWGSWEELKKHYPAVCQMSGDEAHFPLTPDGTGIAAMVFFKPQLMMLRGIAPAPMDQRTPHRHRISLPPIHTSTHPTERHTHETPQNSRATR